MLTALVVEGIFPVDEDLRDRHDLIALLLEIAQNFGQRLRRVLPRVVEQHNGAGAHFACHAFGDLRGGDALPVEAVPTGSSCKGRIIPSMDNRETCP